MPSQPDGSPCGGRQAECSSATRCSADGSGIERCRQDGCDVVWEAVLQCSPMLTCEQSSSAHQCARELDGPACRFEGSVSGAFSETYSVSPGGCLSAFEASGARFTFTFPYESDSDLPTYDRISIVLPEHVATLATRETPATVHVDHRGVRYASSVGACVASITRYDIVTERVDAGVITGERLVEGEVRCSDELNSGTAGTVRIGDALAFASTVTVTSAE